MISLPPIPDAIAKLPRDERGYPVPWFVPWIDGRSLVSLSALACPLFAVAFQL